MHYMHVFMITVWQFSQIWKTGEASDRHTQLKTILPRSYITGSNKFNLVRHNVRVCSRVSADVMRESSVAGAKSWQQKNHKAYGISMSLYDQHPITGKISGLSIAAVWCTSLKVRLYESVVMLTMLWIVATDSCTKEKARSCTLQVRDMMLFWRKRNIEKNTVFILQYCVLL